MRDTGKASWKEFRAEYNTDLLLQEKRRASWSATASDGGNAFTREGAG